MAQPIRAFTTTPSTIPTAGPREVGAGLIAAVSNPLIAEPNSNTPSYFDNYTFTQKRKLSKYEDADRGNYQERRRHFGIFNAPTETFIALLESGVSNSFVDPQDIKFNKKGAVNVLRAVHSYEENLVIGANVKSVLGTEVSLIL